MRTSFNTDLLRDAETAYAESVIRRCVHCGFCTATCPSYLVMGDELDSPRGRIYLIKNMLEQGRPADARTVRHLDRCLSCLSCTTTCPSGVDYMHLIDHARNHIERTYRRPLLDRMLRGLLLRVLPYPSRFRLMAMAGRLARPFARYVPGRLGAAMRMAPARVHPPSSEERPGAHPPVGPRRMRVALLSGCVQPAMAPSINAAAIRLLTRLGCEVTVADSGCCGALAHHMGAAGRARDSALRNIRAWRGGAEGGYDAIVITASGCGTMVKDYGHVFQHDPKFAEEAAATAAKARDICELVHEIGLGEADRAECLRVAYHPPCSLLHGQKIGDLPAALLRQAGFDVVQPAEAHLCCGSAGVYSILQPDIAGQLRERKAGRIRALEAQVMATSNIGCMAQLEGAVDMPVTHAVELLDWATGGPKPQAIRDL